MNWLFVLRKVVSDRCFWSSHSVISDSFSLKPLKLERNGKVDCNLKANRFRICYFSVAINLLSRMSSSILKVSGSSTFKIARNASRSRSCINWRISAFADFIWLSRSSFLLNSAPARRQTVFFLSHHSIFSVRGFISKVMGPATQVSGLTGWTWHFLEALFQKMQKPFDVSLGNEYPVSVNGSAIFMPSASRKLRMIFLRFWVRGGRTPLQHPLGHLLQTSKKSFWRDSWWFLPDIFSRIDFVVSQTVRQGGVYFENSFRNVRLLSSLRNVSEYYLGKVSTIYSLSDQR